MQLKIPLLVTSFFLLGLQQPPSLGLLSQPPPLLQQVQSQQHYVNFPYTSACQQQLERAYLKVNSLTEKEKVIFIKELDEYLNDLGLVKGNSFCSYQHSAVQISELVVTTVNFSRGESSSEYFYGSEEEMKAAQKKIEIDEKAKKNENERKETYLRVNLQTPDSPLTSDILKYSYGTLANIFIHERMHDEINLPMEIEEALCDAAAFHLAQNFFQTYLYREDLAEEAQKMAKGQMHKAEIITETHNKLRGIYAKKALSGVERKMLREEYLSEIGKKLGNSEINEAWIRRQIHYHRYFHELYLVPLKIDLSVENMLLWYVSLPASFKEAEKEILGLCEVVKCKHEMEKKF